MSCTSSKSRTTRSWPGSPEAFQRTYAARQIRVLEGPQIANVRAHRSFKSGDRCAVRQSALLRPEIQRFLYAVTVESHEKGLLFFNRELQKLLEPGDYFFWKGTTTVAVLKADMRQLQLDMSSQEIMPRDKITLRVNFVCQYQIHDPVIALNTIKNYEEQLYILMQLALREYIGRLKELEYIERVSEKISSITLSSSGQIIDQLRQAFQATMAEQDKKG